MKKKYLKLKVLSMAFAIVSPTLFASCGATAESLGGFGTRSAVGTIGYDSKERQILGQARGVGAGVGAIAGMLLAKKMGMSKGWGAALGAGLGAGIGDAVGKNQANKAKGKRLSNSNLKKLIASAKANNAKLRAYNNKVARRIAQIKAAKASDRSAMARSERAAVKKSIAQTDQLIKQREAVQVKLSGSQRNALAREISIAKSQRNTLAAHSATLAKYERVATR